MFAFLTVNVMNNPRVMMALGLLLVWTGNLGAGDSHAPCFDCELYNMMQSDQAFHDKQIDSQCQYPCKCSNRERKCKAGVNMVKDGCDCCYMCARQQGDLCDYKDKCDEVKNLYCDFQLDDGMRGICRARAAKSCVVGGQTYKDGEEFKPDCRRLCSCQNGQYACTSLCPQEERRPSSVHCKYPRLIPITGKCCKEWTCPLPQDQGAVSSEDYGSQGRPASGGGECKKETSSWSTCSVTCGMGLSVRVTNDNDDCHPIQQRRLCFVRPCELNDEHLKGRHCKNMQRAESPLRLTHRGCTSLKEYRPKYCSTCKRERCCFPDHTKTLQIEFDCGHNELTVHNFMWIKSCRCEDRC